MNPRRILRKIDLANCDQCVERLGSLMFSDDANGHRIELTIEDGGQAANLEGMSARGYFFHVVGGQVNEFAVNGTITGNMATVTFPPEAYHKGQNRVVFKVEKTGVSIPVYAAMYHVQDADADTVTDPTDTIESLPELLAQIEAMKTATAAANAAAENATSTAQTAADAAYAAAQEARETAEELGVIDDDVINKVNPWSSQEIADTFCESVSGSGNPVILPDLMERYPLDVVAHIEPYQEGEGDPSPTNVRPIVVPSELVLGVSGKNLCPPLIIRKAISSSTGIISNNNKCALSGPIYIDIEKTYTLSGLDDTMNTMICAYDNDGTYVARTRNSKLGRVFNINKAVFTSTFNGMSADECAYVYVQQQTDSTELTDYTNTVQLELGSTATPYEPYRGSTATMALPADFAGGDVDVTGGTATKKIGKIVFTGSEAFTADNTMDGDELHKRFVVDANVAPNGSPSRLPNLICTHYPSKPAHDTYSRNIGVSHNMSGSQIHIYDPNFSSLGVDAFKAWLASQYAAGTPVTIVYELATPTTSQLSPVVLPATYGDNVITSNATSLTVTGRRAPLNMKRIIDHQCMPMTGSGNPVVLDHPVEGYPLDIVAHIEPTQSGTGTPSPENVRPISVPSELSLQRCGKNLFNPAKLFTDYAAYNNLTNTITLISASGGFNKSLLTSEAGATSARNAGKLIRLHAGNYIVSIKDSIGNYIRISSYNDDGSYSKVLVDMFGVENKHAAFSLTESKLVDIQMIDKPEVGLTITGLQIELGSTATPYEPYRGDTYTMDLPEGFGGGTVSNDGECVQTRRTIVFNGSETGWIFQGYGMMKRAYIILEEPCSGTFDLLCSAAKSSEQFSDNNQFQASFNLNDLRYLQFVNHENVFNALGVTDVDSWKTWLANNNIEVNYQLAAPTTTTITPVTIPAISGENVITSNATTLDVRARADTPHLLGKALDRIAALEAAATDM